MNRDCCRLVIRLCRLVLMGVGNFRMNIIRVYRVLIVVFLVFTVQIYGVTVFHIGNSHTWDLKPNYGLRQIFEASGEDFNNDWQIVCGESLDSIVNDPVSSCVSPNGYTDYVDALTDKAWDVITLQPFPGASGQAEVDALSDLISLARWRSSDEQTRYLVYCTWPIIPNQDLLAYDYGAAWSVPYTSADRSMSANLEFFIYAMKAVRDKFPNLAIEAIPVGAIFEEFHFRALNGEIIGFSGAGALYRDTHHMNNVGRYIAALTTYAVISGNKAKDLGDTLVNGFAVVDEGVDHTLSQVLRLQIAEMVDAVIAAKPFDAPRLKLNFTTISDAPMGVNFKTYTGYDYTLKFSLDLIEWDEVIDRASGNSAHMNHHPTLISPKGFWQLLRY